MLDELEETRTFTLAEARRLLPKVRVLVSRVVTERESLQEMRDEIDRLSLALDFAEGAREVAFERRCQSNEARRYAARPPSRERGSTRRERATQP
jgi:hypothetical protein